MLHFTNFTEVTIQKYYICDILQKLRNRPGPGQISGPALKPAENGAEVTCRFKNLTPVPALDNPECSRTDFINISEQITIILPRFKKWLKKNLWLLPDGSTATAKGTTFTRSEQG